MKMEFWYFLRPPDFAPSIILVHLMMPNCSVTISGHDPTKTYNLYIFPTLEHIITYMAPPTIPH